MSAFFIWLEFSGQPIDETVARSMLSSIQGYGGDAQDLLLNDNLAIGVQSRWTTPEDVGDTQPLLNRSETECFVFDGRIDNREHLVSELSIDVNANSVSESNLSDAQLMHQFLSRFGQVRLAEVIGPFSFVLFDLANGTIICARDAMGGRYLVYRQSEDRLIIASAEQAFMAHPDVGHNLNDAKVSGWLINHQEQEHLSCLDGLSVLNPGCLLEWSSRFQNELSIKTFYRADPGRRIQLESDQVYAQEFRRLLDQAVARRMRCVGNVGSMLSGGMDSVPVTVSAAAIDKSVIAYSWVFDECSAMDERRYSSPMCEKLGIKQELIRCDDIWPAFDESTHCNPLFPIALHYSEFSQQLLSRAQTHGIQVMLTGLHGDLLYQTANKQVLHALRFEGVGSAVAEFFDLKKRHQLDGWTALKRYLLAPILVIQRWLDARRLLRPVVSEILVPEKLKLLRKVPHWLYDVSCKALRPLQYRVVLDGFAGEDTMLGRHMENKFAIERRYPFRDRDLCEFMLAIPTSQLEQLGINRPIVKRAYQSEFTQVLAERNDKTRFVDSLYNGLKRDEKWREELLSVPRFWKNYVKECYIYGSDAENDLKAVVKWQCAYYNFWYKVWYG